jgi:1-deoxyxylulose-5-phosphate synthase
MEYIKLGNTGLDVSRICLGCMSFGFAEGWGHNTWTLNEDDSRSIIKKALDLGINFFDTANVYAKGNSEVILGRALKDFAKRDEVVIATKVRGKMREGPNGEGLSRKAILSEIDNSLKRLNTDYVDLYIIHRWDYKTPIEETMAVLHDLVKAGKVRYIGASAMYAWQFQMCREEKIAATPYSPLASGRLAHDWSETTKRLETDKMAKSKYDSTANADKLVVERLTEIAEKHGTPRAQIALAWLLHKQPVVAPVIGATKIAHLESPVESVSIKLTPEEISYMEELYVPHQIVGHT